MSFPDPDRPPADPVAAVVHPDPYPYYARLVRERPVYRDDRLGMWVVAGAAETEAALGSPDCRVRPLDQPVPAPLRDTPLGAVFGRWVRMSEGADHTRRRALCHSLLERTGAARLPRLEAEWADRLVPPPGGSLADFAFGLAPHVIGSGLGLPEGQLSQVGRWVEALSAGLSPLAAAHDVTAANEACVQLAEWLAGGTEEATANRIALLLQSYEATAGAIGNAVLALRRRPRLQSLLADRPGMIGAFVAEVLRHDPPVQNTRRYAGQDTVVAGSSIPAGETLLVLLAAASRDPVANPRAEEFCLDRPGRRSLAFGAARHACPGEAWAATIAAAGVGCLLRRGLLPAGPPGPVRYRPSVNTRVPLGGGADV